MKNNLNRLIFICFIVFSMLLASSGCTSTTYDVEYEVTGSTSDASLTYENEGGGTSQEDATIPWSYSFKAETDDFVYISAQNQQDSGSVTVTIYVDGEVYKTSTSNGAYVIATASGMLE